MYKKHKFTTAKEQQTHAGQFDGAVFNELKEEPSVTLWDGKENCKGRAIKQINQKRSNDTAQMKRNFVRNNKK
jgi:hypothetical protein